jgi:hypothetical protein
MPQVAGNCWSIAEAVGAAVCSGFGVYCGPLRTGNGALPVALREAGAALYVLGAAMLGLAFRMPVPIGASGQGSGAMPSPPPGPGSSGP